jgi:hypothetical protein
MTLGGIYFRKVELTLKFDRFVQILPSLKRTQAGLDYILKNNIT